MNTTRVVVITMMIGFGQIAFAGDCQNWSSKFDTVTNPDVLRDLRSKRNWDSLIEQAGGPDAVILQFRSAMADARTRLSSARAASRQLAARPEDATSSVTWGQCKAASNALMAAKCEALNMTELIATAEGSIELAQCRKR